MRVALDTNRITDLFRGDLRLVEQLNRAEEVWIPLFALGEIRAGFEGGNRRTSNENLLRSLLAKPTVGVLLPGVKTAEHYGQIFVQLRRAGTPVPDNDLWIAALVVEHDLVLITRDRHFEFIPQIVRA